MSFVTAFFGNAFSTFIAISHRRLLPYNVLYVVFPLMSVLCSLVILIMGTSAGKANLVSTQVSKQFRRSLTQDKIFFIRMKLNRKIIKSLKTVEVKCLDTSVRIMTPLLLIAGCNKLMVKVGLLAK
ncbi:hypothetical protein Fcan01_27702 [Folsomia candida]|uniref:Uncharacterized protein n=1 Tax=Folsomia candida TaxID=158441 RepID=A0A226CW81_FOLCA|nr:hypothetical protein Fcan01_27702 [Folsomia candida]